MMDLVDTRWLVTGDTGFIGRRVVSILHHRGAQVCGLNRGDEGDLRQGSAWRSRLLGFAPHYVLHLAAAGASGSIAPNELREVNVEGTRILLQTLCDSAAPPRVILAGTGAEYASQHRLLTEDDTLGPSSPYGESKATAALVAEAFKDQLSLTWLRLFNIYGPGEASQRLTPYLIQSARAGTPALLSSGEQMRDFSYVDDVANLLICSGLAASRQPSWEVANVGSGVVLPVRQFVECVGAVLLRYQLVLEARFDARPPSAHDSPFYAPAVQKIHQMIATKMVRTSLTAGVAKTVEAILPATENNYYQP
jgi:nucleoside-diphosphate-sugar epimerase